MTGRKIDLTAQGVRVTTTMSFEDAEQFLEDLARVLVARGRGKESANPNARAKAMPISYGEEEWQG